jgi:hypothetical protein
LKVRILSPVGEVSHVARRTNALLEASSLEEGGMAEANEAPRVKRIVVPKPLEDFFAEKLRDRYAERTDVEVVIDRRDGERRDRSPAPTNGERRSIDRRLRAGWWTLPDLPFENEKAS